MSTLKKVMGWLKKYWYIPLFVLGVVIGWVMAPDRVKFKSTVKKEFDAIDAGTKAEKTAAEKGKEAAVAEVEKDYATEKANLTAAQRDEADKLKDNPAALARYIVRAGSASGN